MKRFIYAVAALAVLFSCQSKDDKEEIVDDQIPRGAVDLGFQSKLKDGTLYNLYWASSNLCETGLCTHPEDYGDYYAWGSTETHYSGLEPLTWKEGKEDGYIWDNYKWSGGDDYKITKYCTEEYEEHWAGEGECDNTSLLDLEDDVAHLKLGGKWRTPTSREFLNLINNCTTEWTSVNGVSGMKFTGPNGNSIFLPAAGRMNGIDQTYAGITGFYWSSYISVIAKLAQSMYVEQSDNNPAGFAHLDRSLGFTIRPVTE